MKFVFVIIFCLYALCGCGKDYIHIIYDNLSDIREIMYEGSNDLCYASLICGQREKDYILNGVSTTLVPFGIITCEGICGEDIDYILIVNGTNYEGVLQKNPFEDNYMADIGKIVDFDEVTLHININEKTIELKLFRVDNEFKYKSSDVIKFVSNEYRDVIKQFIERGVFKGEVYLKILSDENSGEKKFWYFNIISTNGKSFVVVISPYNLNVLSVQKTL